MSPLQIPTVALLRDPPHERRLSMERYADRVQEGIEASQRFRVEPVAMQRDRPGWRRHHDRLFGYMVGAARRRAEVFHVVDHGFAHVSRWLPADRTVVTCHDLMALRTVLGQTGMQSRNITVARFRWSVGHMRRAAHVVCDSTATRDDVVNFLRVEPAKTSVIALGVERRFRQFDPGARRAVRRRLGLDDAQVVVGNVSTGAEYKNPAGALRTLRALRDRGVPALLLRTGRGFTPAHRELQQRLGLDPFVIERGIVDEDELVATYNACDVLLHPSYWEGFGWPPLEAMSCGVPVVTSTAPSLLEVTDGSGLTASADDHAALAAQVIRALEPGTAEELRRGGLKRAEELRWSTSIEKLLDLYARVSAAASSRPAGALSTHRSGPGT
jgi:glycosyltransferase involved in cell wall biosynthesis